MFAVLFPPPIGGVSIPAQGSSTEMVPETPPHRVHQEDGGPEEPSIEARTITATPGNLNQRLTPGPLHFCTNS